MLKSPFPPVAMSMSIPTHQLPRLLTCLALIACVPPVANTLGQTAAETGISFSRDVLPILSDRCFHCHGPDASDRQADLRLDLLDAAVADRGGYAAITPRSIENSELFTRITTDDPDRLMPPADSHCKPLSPSEIETIRAWIEAGAPWGRHWAFEPPQRPNRDAGSATEDPLDVNPIDRLVRRRLAAAGLDLAREAPPATLLRRLSLDLIGLPPTPEELDAFLQDRSPDAYERAVDRLLASPHHGERLAMWWLDAARYSDTDGFQGDATRTNWPWRDWAVRAFNENLPFDQFTIQQFAGDLLPEATTEQILATCFHRNHMTNGEGGRDPEESRIDYVIDRVNTTGTVWLGLTLGCAQCHAHKFDPISHEDYYSLFAFFNSIDEDGKAGGGAKPFLKYRSPHVGPAVAEAQGWVDKWDRIAAAAKQTALADYPAWLAEQIASVTAGYTPWRSPEMRELRSVEGTELVRSDDGVISTQGPHPRQEDYVIAFHPGAGPLSALRLEVFTDPGHTGGKYSRGKTGNFILTNVKLQLRRRGVSQVRDVEFETAIANIEQQVSGRNYGKVKDTLDDDPRNGWTLPEETAAATAVATFVLAQPLTLAADEELVLWLFHRSTDGDANIGRFRLTLTDQVGAGVRSLDPMPVEQLAAIVAAIEPDMPIELATVQPRIDEPLRERLIAQFLHGREVYQAAKRRADEAQRHLASVRSATGDLDVMVLGERAAPRPTHVLVRGVWDQPGEPVERRFPTAILPWPAAELQSPTDGQAESGNLTRLDLARWLVHPDNPLTARVVANHLWQITFGDGLVRTVEDFGLQGERPTHPELLDWLAVELVESGWDLRHLLRLMVTSRVYRQSSFASPTALEADPDNRLLARGARYRLPSWMIRDAALRSSGLLNPAIGGPPVFPQQPPGVWEEIFMGRYTYHPSPGPAQYRRSLYAFWRRSSAPTFLFDAAQRRVCEVQTLRTNTPLQALTLLNDTGMLEAAVALAREVVAAEATPAARVRRLFLQVCSREPSAAEMQILQATLARAATHYQSHPADAQAVITAGQGEPLPDDQAAEVAAHAILASSVFNLDEAMTHE